MEYYICAENGLGKLQEAVNKKISEGFKPQGGVFAQRYIVQENADHIKHDWLWVQAVIRKPYGKFKRRV